MSDPFHVLGLGPDARRDDVRQARRQLAKQHHPDTGGDPSQMRAINEAAAAALRLIDTSDGIETSDGRSAAPEEKTHDAGTHDAGHHWHGGVSDVPSFTIEALPAEAFEALRIVAASIGEVIDDDPPYRLDVAIDDPLRCWCRLELLPDAGSSTVNITVGRVAGARPPSVEAVRDLWIAELNQLDW